MDEEKKEPISVVALKVAGGSALVEWVENGEVRRGYLPTNKVREGALLPPTELKRALPYGVRWEKVKLIADPQRLAKELHDRDIWTYDDLVKNPGGGLSALQAAYRVDLAALLSFAREQQEE